jgi:hypothetical protein
MAQSFRESLEECLLTEEMAMTKGCFKLLTEQQHYDEVKKRSGVQ